MLAALIAKLMPEQGYEVSCLDGVKLFRANDNTGRMPMVYEPCICIVAQGHKVGYVNEESFRYDPDHYLVTSVHAPFSCESFATPDEPLLGLSIRISPTMLQDLVTELPQLAAADLPRISGAAAMDAAMKDAVTRLAACLQQETDARILGQGIIREILYWALQGEQAASLVALANRSGRFAQVAKAIDVIHRDYASTLDVDSLAAHADMSPSTFHRAFKKMCAESPLQYIKKIRLNKARELIVEQGIRIQQAAQHVGYESPSQFSREFKRHFGQSPAVLALR